MALNLGVYFRPIPCHIVDEIPLLPSPYGTILSVQSLQSEAEPSRVQELNEELYPSHGNFLHVWDYAALTER